MPEVTLVIGMLLLILTDLFKKAKLLLIVSLVLPSVATWFLLSDGLPESQSLFEGFVTVDESGTAWRLVLLVATFISLLLISRDAHNTVKGETYVLIFGILLGGHLLVLASHLLMVYLGIEIMSICAYALTLFHFTKVGSEASIKYLVFGAVSSALMLYGISWIYTITGSLFFLEPEFSDALLNANLVPLAIGLLLILAGLLFKAGAVPFHVWSPDVYTAAPTPIVAFFSTVPKIAALAFLMKWLLVIHLFGLGPLDWVAILALIAMLSMLVGNFSALRQQNVKRLMAYSSIAHTGFLIVPIISLSEQASRGLLFYAIIYILMNLAAFLIIHFFETDENITTVKQYAGMIKKYPFLSILFITIMVSLVGIPPTAGFTAKLLIFTSLWEAYLANESLWLLGLFCFGLLNTVVALFYYLKVPFYMIFREQDAEDVNFKVKKYPFTGILASLLVLMVLIFFFKPDWLLGVVNKISFVF